MRKTILAGAIGVFALTGCATVSDYNMYATTQQLIATKQAEAEIARSNALKEIAQTGDTTARVAAVMSLQFGAQQQQTQQQIAAPTSFGDTMLKWASVLVPSLTQVYAIGKNTDVAITHSNNSVKSQQSNNNMVVDLVQGREDKVVIGTQDDVLLYPVAPTVTEAE